MPANAAVDDIVYVSMRMYSLLFLAIYLGRHIIQVENSELIFLDRGVGEKYLKLDIWRK